MLFSIQPKDRINTANEFSRNNLIFNLLKASGQYVYYLDVRTNSDYFTAQIN